MAQIGDTLHSCASDSLALLLVHDLNTCLVYTPQQHNHAFTPCALQAITDMSSLICNPMPSNHVSRKHPPPTAASIQDVPRRCNGESPKVHATTAHSRPSHTVPWPHGSSPNEVFNFTYSHRHTAAQHPRPVHSHQHVVLDPHSNAIKSGRHIESPP